MKISLMYFIKNEWPWIAYSLASMKGHVDEIVIFDETPELHGRVGADDSFLYRPHDPIDVMDQKAYENLFNQAIQTCTGDWIIWLHADMAAYNGEVLWKEIERVVSEDPDALRMDFRVTSFLDRKRMWQGHGRRDRWPLIVRNGHGLHYYGRYGHQEEDFYFFDLTGEIHESRWATNTPYEIHHTEFHVAHFSDAKPRAFREERMRKCLFNQFERPYEEPGECFMVESVIENHPRVTHEEIADEGFEIVEVGEDALPAVFREHDFGFTEVD